MDEETHRSVFAPGMSTCGASPMLAQAKSTRAEVWRTAGLAASQIRPSWPSCLCPLDLSGRAAHMMVMVRKTFGTASRACGVRQGFLLFSLCRSRPFLLPAGLRRGTAPPPGGAPVSVPRTRIQRLPPFSAPPWAGRLPGASTVPRPGEHPRRAGSAPAPEAKAPCAR